MTHDECLCRAIDMEDVKPVINPSPSPDLSGPMDDGCGLCTSASFCACKASAAATSSSYASSQSPVIGLSAGLAPSTTQASASSSYATAAVPLRLGRVRPKANAIWALTSPAAVTPPKSAEAVCSGDPSNCDACRDDRFGESHSTRVADLTCVQAKNSARTCLTRLSLIPRPSRLVPNAPETV
jgi:hypothetical protein